MIVRNVIYSEPQDVFFKDVLLNKVADKMQLNQQNISSGKVSDSEFRAWKNSIPTIKNLLELSEVKDTYISFEYLVPYTQKRIDCM